MLSLMIVYVVGVISVYGSGHLPGSYNNTELLYALLWPFMTAAVLLNLRGWH